MDTESVLRSFDNHIRKLGSTESEVYQGRRALLDMINKGIVCSEELKGHLGSVMPGAIQLFAEAEDISCNELLNKMSKGEVLANDILPKVSNLINKKLLNETPNAL